MPRPLWYRASCVPPTPHPDASEELGPTRPSVVTLLSTAGKEKSQNVKKLLHELIKKQNKTRNEQTNKKETQTQKQKQTLQKTNKQTHNKTKSDCSSSLVLGDLMQDYIEDEN